MVFDGIGDRIMPSQLLHILPHPLLSTLRRLILDLMLNLNAKTQLFLLLLLLPGPIHLHYSKLVLLDETVLVVFLLF